MLIAITLLVVSGGVAGFMVNRLYVMAAYKAINVKGQHYDRAADPFQFWFFVGSACFGLLFGLGIFGLSSAAIFGFL
ncbi:hypothetical protein U1839_21040 [Sphingomonas sp. RT2P30]|uniref:hypothetical protein n=1 Tax=Parasphingomonas halimpatiens TaxID=3096162 RepID=UPI002FC6970D